MQLHLPLAGLKAIGHLLATAALIVPSLTGESTYVATTVAPGHSSYRISLTSDSSLSLQVVAELPTDDGIFTIGEGHPHPEGVHWGDFIENLFAVDADGAERAVERIGRDQWRVEGIGVRRLTVRYTVRLDHDRHNWPPSVAEATYTRNGSVFFRGFAVLVATSAITSGTIIMEIPDDWSSTSPLRQVGSDARARRSDSRSELLFTGLLFGPHHSEIVESGGNVLEFGVTPDLPDARETIRSSFGVALDSARAIFGANPASRYAVIASEMRERPGGGGAGLGNGMALLLSDNPVENPRGIWSVTLIHELLHMWLGSSIQSRGTTSMEWFYEGFTDYLTMTIAGHSGLTNELVLRNYIARLWSGYLDQVGEMPLTAAGADKARHYDLIYGGGMSVALLLDLELRHSTDGAQNLRTLFASIYSEFGEEEQPLQLSDIVSLVAELSGEDLSWIFERYVTGIEAIEMEELFGPLGLVARIRTLNGRSRPVLEQRSNASPGEKQLRMEIFGW